MNSLRDVWDNIKQFYTHCNWHSRKKRNEKNGRKRNTVKKQVQNLKHERILKL